MCFSFDFISRNLPNNISDGVRATESDRDVFTCQTYKSDCASNATISGFVRPAMATLAFFSRICDDMSLTLMHREI